MTNLEEIFHQLPQMVLNLKLYLGNSDQITQQVTLINNIQLQLTHLQTIIIEEVKLQQVNNYPIQPLPPIGTITTLFLDHIFLPQTDMEAKTKYIIAKFGNPTTEISINDLQAKINYWIEWADFLRVVSTDILNQSELVSQLNSHSHHSNLCAQVQHLSEILKIDLALTNSQILPQQLQQLKNAEAEALQIKEKLTNIINNIHLHPNFLTILTGISSFCGQSGLTLEWLDDDQELIISSDGKFHELTDIIQECQKLQATVDNLIIEIKNFTQQAERFLKHSSKPTQTKGLINYQPPLIPKFTLPKIFYPIIIIASGLLVLISTGLIIRQRNAFIPGTVLTSRQESTAVTNFNSALKLGLEASALVENPPYPVIVWQEAETKWLQAIELLESVPEGSSVYTQASQRLFRYRRNRRAISEKVMMESQATADLQTAQKLATEATFFVQNSPQSVPVLNQAKEKLEQAISLLENIPQSTTIYPQAQEILPIYQSNYAGITILIKR